MKKLVLLIFTAFIIISCKKEYKMIYHRNGGIETEIIKAKNDIDAYDQAYLQINAMKKTVEIFKSSGIKSSLNDVPSTFSIVNNDGKQVFIDIKKKDSLYNKWSKIK